jgi:pimeloyl-ACP methyl ester carboxylesterase
MEFQFTDFDPGHFRAEPRRTAIGPWTVEHMSFATPATLEHTPLVFIGGAFHYASSFLREVRHFLPQRPIIIVDLPGQGQNNQLSESLDFGGLADVFRRFLESQGLGRVIPIGLSYGSGVGFTFAQQFPEKVERLILGGTTEQLRVRVHQALRAGFWYLDEGRDDLFADGVIHHLLNLPHRQKTGITDRLIQALRVGMLELTPVERIRYRHNTNRLFKYRLDGQLSCPTLVFAGKYDNFTAPFESLALANRCSRAEFVLLEQTDHLSPIEAPKTVLAVYDAFLNDRPVADIPGVLAGSAALEACRERRLLGRRVGRRRDVRIRDMSGAESRAALHDYNAHGCLQEPLDGAPVATDDAPVHISIPAIGANGDAVLLPDKSGARAVFLHDAFGTLGTMPVQTVEMPVPSEIPGMGRISLAQRLMLPNE